MAAPEIQYARTQDGVSIPCWTLGNGPALMMLDVRNDGDIDWEWDTPEIRAWYERLAQERMLVGYSMRPCSSAEEVSAAYQFPTLLSDLGAVADHLGLDRFALYAIWNSGPVAMRYAALHPHRVSHLILCGTFPSGSQILAGDAVEAMRVMIAADHATFAQVMWQQATGFQARPLADRIAARWTRRWNGETEAAQVGPMLQHDARPDLDKIVAPTLVLQRKDYALLPDELVREIAAGIPNARLMDSPGPGLLPYAGDFTETADAIDAFLDPPSGAAEGSDGPDIHLVLFTDVEASTDFTDRLGDAEARDLLREHERLTREALAQHGGTEIKTMGDGFMASFTSASGALDAAIAMQQAITDHFGATETPIRIRIGINAGEPIEEDDDLYGTAVIQAARVMGLADGVQILVTDTVRNLVAGKDYRFSDHGTHDLKGFEEPARLFDVSWEQA